MTQIEQDTVIEEKVEYTNENQETEDIEQKNINILIISERDGKVYLPYTQTDLDYYMGTNKYRSEEAVIKRKFTLPLSRYSNATVSRFIEGFKLMREREKSTLGECLKYAWNLIYERRLHPAIITACKTQDDLDVYLACLQENILELFDSFQIRFDYAPMMVRKNDELQYFEGV